MSQELALDLRRLSSEQLEMVQYAHQHTNKHYLAKAAEGTVDIGGYGIGHAQRVAGAALILACSERLDPKQWHLYFIEGLIHDWGREERTDPRSKTISTVSSPWNYLNLSWIV